MTDTGTSTGTETDKKPIAASIGAVQRVEFKMPTDIDLKGDPSKTAGKIDGESTKKDEKKDASPQFTDEHFKEYFKTKFGIEYEGDEKLKAILNHKPTAEPTEEEKKQAATAKEKRRIDKWIAGGGTVENYVGLKNLAEANDLELALNLARKELTESKLFSEEEIESLLKDRYYQLTDEELEQLEDETDKEFAKRKKEFGAKKLAVRSSYTKDKAKGVLADLEKSLESEDLQAKEELQISANIDEKFKTLKRKDTYEIGEINGKAISPIESEVPESELKEIHKMLRDTEKRNNFLFTEDGNFNLTNIADMLIENQKLKSAMKVSYHEGATRTNDFWQKTFGARSAQELGVGGSTASSNGKNANQVASFGKTQKTQLQSAT